MQALLETKMRLRGRRWWGPCWHVTTSCDQRSTTEDVGAQRVADSPGDRDGALALVLDVAGRAEAEEGSRAVPVIGPRLPRQDEHMTAPDPVVEVSLARRGAHGRRVLGLPVEQLGG